MLKIANGIEIIDLSKPKYGELEHAHCSSIISFPDGTVMGCYFHAIEEANRHQAIYGTWKDPNSTKWTIPKVISKDIQNWRMEGNPVLWQAPDTKILYLFYITSWGGWSTCILRYKTSTDQGQTWSKSTKIYPHISRVSKNPAIMTSKGWYILPATIEFQECVPLFFISKDQGKTWQDTGARITVPEQFWPPNKAETSKFPQRELDQPTIIERKDGSIFCLMRAYRPLGKMYQVISQDGGLTWGDAEPSVLPNPDGGFNMIRLQSGNVAIIYNHSSTQRNPLSVALSEDEGKTWKYRQNICEFHPNDPSNKEEKPENFQYPTLFQGSDGLIHATWSHGHPDENAQKGNCTDIQYTSFKEDWIKQQAYFEDEWNL